jgi:hypothetical protein
MSPIVPIFSGGLFAKMHNSETGQLAISFSLRLETVHKDDAMLRRVITEDITMTANTVLAT